jgi:hypothetical protein
MKLVYAVLVLLGGIMSNSIHAQGPPPPPLADSLLCKTFVSGKGWGYDIYKNCTLVIHQPMIPAISESRPFSKERYAMKTGLFVVKKIKAGEWPPALTTKELKKLKVLK